MRTGPTKQEKTTEIYFDEKGPTIFIRTHNTDLKNRLTAYAAAHPGECRQTRTRAARNLRLKRDASLSGSPPHTERIAAWRQAKRRKTNKRVLGLR